MADSPDIKVQKKVNVEKTESFNLDTSLGVKRDKKVKRSRWQRKLQVSKRSLLRKIFSSKKVFDPEKDNILNTIIDGIADKIGETVEGAFDNQVQDNPLQELEELHPPKLPDLKELADELAKEKIDDSGDDKKVNDEVPPTPYIFESEIHSDDGDNDDDKKNEEVDKTPPPPKNRIRL